MSPLPAAPDDPRLTRQLAILHELVDQGMDLARRVHAEALAATTPASLVAYAVERHALVARGIRHALALECFLVRTHTTRAAAQARADDTRNTRNRDYLRHRVDGAITIAGGRTHPMRIRLEEHLANPGLDAEFARRPFEQIVAGICRDLGIAPPPPTAAAKPPNAASSTQPRPAIPIPTPAARPTPPLVMDPCSHATGPP